MFCSINERWNKSIKDFEATDVQELYLTALTQMFDPHTTFMNIKENHWKSIKSLGSIESHCNALNAYETMKNH